MDPEQTKQENRTSLLERRSSIDYLNRIKQSLKANICPERANCEEPVCMYCNNNKKYE